jgi:hypothetical protein
MHPLGVEVGHSGCSDRFHGGMSTPSVRVALRRRLSSPRRAIGGSFCPSRRERQAIGISGGARLSLIGLCASLYRKSLGPVFDGRTKIPGVTPKPQNGVVEARRARAPGFSFLKCDILAVWNWARQSGLRLLRRAFWLRDRWSTAAALSFLPAPRRASPPHGRGLATKTLEGRSAPNAGELCQRRGCGAISAGG